MVSSTYDNTQTKKHLFEIFLSIVTKNPAQHMYHDEPGLNIGERKGTDFPMNSMAAIRIYGR